MTNTRNVSSGIVEENKELNKKAGYYYEVEDCVELNSGVFVYEVECWTLYNDGTLYYSMDKMSPREDYGYGFDGTFDKAKYQDYVNQMKEHREDWMNEIKVNVDWD